VKARGLLRPIDRFLKIEAASGILLLGCALIALGWANSPYGASYHALWRTPLGVELGRLSFQKDLQFFINDGLMAVFFFVVGLEIRRELFDGELSDARRAALPAVAALGGMLAPALIYLAFNPSAPGKNGWGVPMATDIAFAVGILTLLGKRVPGALRVLLLALAIIDDIGAVLVIALFYSTGLELGGLVVAGGGVVAILLMQRLGLRRPIFYLGPALVCWSGLLASGVHPAISGVIVGLLTPARVTLGAGGEAISPVVRLRDLLHPWVSRLIMPLFALANAGVTIGEVRLTEPGAPRIALGLGLGLLLGKPIGIVLASIAAVRSGLGALPRGIGLRELLVVGAAGGIGFTMALFVAHLAFPNPELLAVAKLAVLVGSALSAAVGLVLGRLLLSRSPL